MATITSYATLVKAIQDEAENEGLEFTDFIPLAIDLAEEKLFRELDLTDLEEDQIGTLFANVNIIPKPTGYKFADSLYLERNGTTLMLKKKFKNFLKDFWPSAAATGTPKYYADETPTSFIVAPTTDVDYTYALRYTKEPPRLSISNTTNYFTDKCPSILFYACMIEMTRFMKSWAQLPIWEGVYTNSQQAWNVQEMRYRRDGQIVPNSPDGGPNSLKQTITSKA